MTTHEITERLGRIAEQFAALAADMQSLAADLSRADIFEDDSPLVTIGYTGERGWRGYL